MGLTHAELTEIAASLGQPGYRAIQLMNWIYRRGVVDLAAMTDLPWAFKQDLRGRAYEIRLPVVAGCRETGDGTVKYLLALSDGEQVESVYIPEGPRRTVCVSTQVGCGMGCAFCATAREGLVRNLGAGEIVGQVLVIQQAVGIRVTNVVAMGQGEPLANYDATISAFDLLDADHGMGIAARHLAISTCGLPGGIIRLAGEGRQWRLTVSLHAARDELRDILMPINRRFPLSQLREACTAYCAASGRRITLAYVLIAGCNDARAEAQALLEFCRGLLVHVNLIPWNVVEGVSFAPPNEGAIQEFRRWLTTAGVNATVRRTRGAEFSAACGQLRGGRRGGGM